MTDPKLLLCSFTAGAGFIIIAGVFVYSVFLIAKEIWLEAKAKQDDERVEELKRMQKQQDEWLKEKFPLIEKWGNQ